MKKLFTILFILSGFIAGAQVYTPMDAAGYRMKRLIPDSTLHIPSFCGVPNLRETAIQRKAAIAFDSCNHRFYFYDPKTNLWDTLTSFNNIVNSEEHPYFTTELVRGSFYADQPILYDSAFGRFYLDTASATGVATKHDLFRIDTAVIAVTGYMSGDTSIISIDKNGGGNNKIYLLDPGGSGGAHSDSTITAAANQSIFSFSTFTGTSSYRNDIVFLNGYPLTPQTDYTATGNLITLSYGVVVGDKLRYHK